MTLVVFVNFSARSSAFGGTAPCAGALGSAVAFHPLRQDAIAAMSPNIPTQTCDNQSKVMLDYRNDISPRNKSSALVPKS